MHVQRRMPAITPRHAAIVTLVPLLLAVAACSSQPGTPASPGGQADAARRTSGGATGALAMGPALATDGTASSMPGEIGGGTGTAQTGTGVATPNTAIAYPYPIYAGTPGVAADHTIVVAGVGLASVKADLSDQAASQRTALAAALADAKAQADVVARATGVSISGVLSVSVSSGGSYAVPMAAGTEGSAPGAPGDTSVSPPAIAPTVPTTVSPSTTQIQVSVTVAYSIG